MKRTHLIAAIVCLMAIAGLSQDAFARGRMYHPGLGRFTQRDPLGTADEPPMARSLSGAQFTQRDPTVQYAGGMNLYQYCSSNPQMRVDPWGRRDYKIGTGDPRVGHDPGAGAHGSEEWTVKMGALRQAILGGLYAVENSMPNAVTHMRHYFGGSGNTYSINLVDLVNDVPSGKQLYKQELAEAMAFVEGLDVGDHNITSGAASGGYARKSESKDWYFAVGGYSAWGKGTANVSCFNGKKKYKLTFVYNFRDRYNWDTGKSVTIAGIKVKDAFMGTFHRQGYAKEFDMVGITTETIEWTEGENNNVRPNPGGGAGLGRGGR